MLLLYNIISYVYCTIDTFMYIFVYYNYVYVIYIYIPLVYICTYIYILQMHVCRRPIHT